MNDSFAFAEGRMSLREMAEKYIAPDYARQALAQEEQKVRKALISTPWLSDQRVDWETDIKLMAVFFILFLHSPHKNATFATAKTWYV